MKKLFVLAFLITFIGLQPAIADNVKRLTKTEAKTILEGTGYSDVVVGAVILGIGVQGMAALGGDSVARVLAIGKWKGKKRELDKTLFYDHELGWFDYEISEEKIRFWTKSGYKSYNHKQK